MALGLLGSRLRFGVGVEGWQRLELMSQPACSGGAMNGGPCVTVANWQFESGSFTWAPAAINLFPDAQITSNTCDASDSGIFYSPGARYAGSGYSAFSLRVPCRKASGVASRGRGGRLEERAEEVKTVEILTSGDAMRGEDMLKRDSFARNS